MLNFRTPTNTCRQTEAPRVLSNTTVECVSSFSWVGPIINLPLDLRWDHHGQISRVGIHVGSLYDTLDAGACSSFSLFMQLCLLIIKNDDKATCHKWAHFWHFIVAPAWDPQKRLGPTPLARIMQNLVSGEHKIMHVSILAFWFFLLVYFLFSTMIR